MTEQLARKPDSRHLHDTEPQYIISYDPATGERVGAVLATAPEDVKPVMERARRAQSSWAALSLDDRLKYIKKVKQVFYQHHEKLVNMMVKEQGKVAHEALIEILPSMALIDYYLKNARRILQPESSFVKLLPHRKHERTYRPHGTVLVISPWNFPILLTIAPVIAALIAGNTVILKPSEYSSLVAELFKKILWKAGIPRDVFQVVYGYGDVGAALIDAQPDKICFTGSEATGRKIAAKAGEMLIPVTLELGGKDAAIVLEDADLNRTARGVVWGGMFNAGQACLSVERVYVMRSIMEPLLDEMKQVVEKHVRPGPGQDRKATYGAMTTETQIEIVETQVQEALNKGARLITGGKRVPGKGRFFEPTILTDVTDNMSIATQETFGPVITVTPVDSEEEAIHLNNASPYGLTASIWTRDQDRAKKLAEKLHVGVTSINDHVASASVPDMPWGGVGASGHGRTRSAEGLLEMCVPHAQSSERFKLPIEPFWIPYTPIKREFVERFVHLWFGNSLLERTRALNPFYRRDKD